MHPEIIRFVESYEEQLRKSGSYRYRIGRYELAFLELVIGPAFAFNFDGLELEYPFKDFKGGDRFADFAYHKDGIRLLIEIDGFTTHARNISPGEFDDHLSRQNDLILQGWMILRFSVDQVMKQPMLCQRQVIQAIGHWWTLMNRTVKAEDSDIWMHRKQLISQFAFRYGGFLRVSDISHHFSIPARTARDWVSRFAHDGFLVPVRPNKKVIGYQLSGFDKGQRL